jgi:hypothetical protein
MIEVTQHSNGSFNISWDPKDPNESHLNNLTEQDFVDLIQAKLESIIPPDPDPWLYMISTNCETGGGYTACIMMTQARPCCADDFDPYYMDPTKPITTQQERAIRKFREKFGDYHADKEGD